jgi:hypothetical protein
VCIREHCAIVVGELGGSAVAAAVFLVFSGFPVREGMGSVCA